jgi:post-segregation antitoxin (ccd killing protein)
MANVTIYLDDSLRERVRRAGLPISRICQQALNAELAETEDEDQLRLPGIQGPAVDTAAQ